jgi:hypothetical protein
MLRSVYRSGSLVAALLATGSLWSQYIPPFNEVEKQASSKSPSLEQRVSQLEKNQALTLPQSARALDAYAYGAFLYWQPEIPNFVYAVTGNILANQPLGVGDVVNHSEYKLVSFDFEPGFRVGLGKVLAFDNWALNLEWTRLHTKGNTSQASAQGDTTLFEVWAQSGGTKIPAQTITATPKIRYDLVELDLIRGIWFSKSFALGLILGVEGVVLNESFKIDTLAEPGDNANHFVRMKNNFAGGGSSIGVDANFYCGKGFSIFGFGKTALYVGGFFLETRDEYTATTTNEAIVSTKQSNRTPTIQSSYQTNLGVEWKTDLYKGKAHLALWTAYEMNFFQTQIKLRQFIDFANTSLLFNEIGDVGFYGVLFGAKLMF